SLYNLEPNVYSMTVIVIRVFGVLAFFKVMNWTLLIGILRAGGDTRAAFLIDVLPVYLFEIPAVFLCVYFKFSVGVTLGIVGMGEVIKLVIGFKRYVSKKWLNDVTI
ncbi:MAG: MATE family efflux transporter, partial [Fusobacteriaceae bacterium]